MDDVSAHGCNGIQSIVVHAIPTFSLKVIGTENYDCQSPCKRMVFLHKIDICAIGYLSYVHIDGRGQT
jgi:hypothetical protein